MGLLQELAEATPPERVRHIDLLRAVAIGAVVLGHWLAAVVIHEDGLLTSMNALEVLDWAHPVTWLFQVMPLFFIVGGYANAASFHSHRRRGGGHVGWLLKRSERLVRPVTVLLVVVSAAGLLASLLGTDTRQLGIMAHGAVLPLWFLVAYLTVVVLTPVMYSLHRGFGLAVPAVLVVLVAAGEVGRLVLGTEWVAYGSFLFLWLAVHQAGFAWQDGRLPAKRHVAVPLVLVGLGSLLVATLLGPYPVSMINVPGAEIHNVSPPTLALLALAVVQLGLALLLNAAGERWMQRARPWGAVIAVNTVTFTMFLWHMPALVITAFLLDAVGALPTQAVDTPEWLAWRVPWVMLIAVVLAALVVVFGRVERAGDPATGFSGWVGKRLFGGPRSAAGNRARAAAAVLALVAAIAGMLVIADAGPGDHGPLPLPTHGVLVWLAAAAVLWLVRVAAVTGRAVR